MYPFSCVRQIARYLPHHRSENASKTHPKSSHDKFKTASKLHTTKSYLISGQTRLYARAPRESLRRERPTNN